MAEKYRQNMSYDKIVWDEGKHPRDKDGKFISGSGSSSSDSSSAGNREAPNAYSFNRLDTKHHIAHAKEMGFKNPKEYEAAAVEFFNSDRGTLYYSNKSKKYYRYEEKTGLFAVSSENVVHTFMTRTKKQFERKVLQEELKKL